MSVYSSKHLPRFITRFIICIILLDFLSFSFWALISACLHLPPPENSGLFNFGLNASLESMFIHPFDTPDYFQTISRFFSPFLSSVGYKMLPSWFFSIFRQPLRNHTDLENDLP